MNKQFQDSTYNTKSFLDFIGVSKVPTFQIFRGDSQAHGLGGDVETYRLCSKSRKLLGH